MLHVLRVLCIFLTRKKLFRYFNRALNRNTEPIFWFLFFVFSIEWKKDVKKKEEKNFFWQSQALWSLQTRATTYWRLSPKVSWKEKFEDEQATHPRTRLTQRKTFFLRWSSWHDSEKLSNNLPDIFYREILELGGFYQCPIVEMIPRRDIPRRWPRGPKFFKVDLGFRKNV